MTELIDLATLANLGQHFSTHEDVAELKAALTSVQTDLALIKKFLFQQYGSDFSSALRQSLAGEQGDLQTQMPVVKKSAPLVRKINKVSAPPQRKPPPLQRFTRVNSNDEEVVRHLSKNVTVFRQQSSIAGNTLVRGGGGVGGGGKIVGSSSGTAIKSEKFHRNFLSMKSLSKSRTASGGSSASSSLSNGGSSAIFLMNKISGGGSNISRQIKTEPQQISPSGSSGSGGGGVNKMPRLKAAVIKSEIYGNGMNKEFNVSEDAAYAAVADDDGNFVEETGGDEEDYAYGNKSGYGVNEDYDQGDYDDPMTQMEYQDEDGTIYEEDYSEANDLIDANGSLGLIRNVASSSAQLLNGVGRMISTSTTISRKTPQQRRISLPISSSQGSMDPDHEGDPNYTKKCKVCHEDVPSYSLFNHVIATRYNGEVPTRTICKKTFTYKQGLISHMRYHDAEKYDKACSYCGKKFIRRSDVIIHERRLHTGERPYLCPVPECNQGFVRRYCLLTHVKTNHGEPYMSQLVADGRRKSS